MLDGRFLIIRLVILYRRTRFAIRQKEVKQLDEKMSAFDFFLPYLQCKHCCSPPILRMDIL